MNWDEISLLSRNFYIKEKNSTFKSSLGSFFNYKTKSEKILLDLMDNSSKEKYYKLDNDIESIIKALALKFNCKYIIALGCNQVDLIISLSKTFKIIGIDNKKNILPFKSMNVPGVWIEQDFEKKEELQVERHILKDSMIISINFIENLENPHHLLFSLKTIMKISPLCVVTTQERDLQKDNNSLSKRNWNITEFGKLLKHFKLNTEFIGLIKTDTSASIKDHILSIIGNDTFKKTFHNSIKVVALMAVYNEEDVISYSIKKLIEQGVYVYVIDNWSTDTTYEILKEFKYNPYFIGYERYPANKEKHANNFEFTKILERKTDLATQIDADWFIHCDADEIRESPWERLKLVEAIQYVDHMGYNAIDHTVINFQPIDNKFKGGNFEKHFKYFEFGHYSAGCVKTWKNTKEKVNLSDHGGHQANFKGRKVAPYNFLIKHYPLRSQQHAEKKVFEERKPRYMKELKERGWHVQYNTYNAGDSFLRSQDELFYFHKSFHLNFLAEMLTNR
ncbi:glycosyltransferase family 2 protein [Cytobacillus firmus]|uniref:glycosyltransferase family 2 protein n=1 Tax=Cytobacillus firmus TaxID=1399 RepID=UPI002161E280|nr:glycosyltransferase family 2 protein [Cytobacillus firmus]MCS0673866.1 glycosyltransferase family 2 protein [Cytobacillus firmus]